MKTLILSVILLSVFLEAQPRDENAELSDWKFLAFQGSEKVYYLPASLKSVGDIFRIKLLQISGRKTDVQYTVFIEDYNRTDVSNRVVQVNTYDKFWRPIDEINIEKNSEDEQWVRIKKGSDSFKIYERLLIGVQQKYDE